MKKGERYILGGLLIILGIIMGWHSISMTGNVVASSSQGIGSVFGLALIVVGALIAISSEGRRIRREVSQLVGTGTYNAQEIRDIQDDFRKNASLRREYTLNKEKRKPVYSEMAEVMRKIASGVRRETGGHNIHVTRNIPNGLTNVTADSIAIADAPVLNGYKNQPGRGSERYVFDADTGKFLGIAWHPGGANPGDLRWRRRFRYSNN